MEKTKESLREKADRLEKEAALYRDVIMQLPFNFTYHDALSGQEVVKKDDGLSVVPSNDSVEKELKITSEVDISFEQIENYLTPIFDLVHHHIVFIDSEGIITYCNIQAAKDLEVDRDSITGKHIRELLGLPDAKINLLETLRTEKPIVNREVLDKNYGINNTHIFRDKNGKVLRVIGTFQFLNGIKEAEKMGLAGRIAAGIAHEIRNPLTTVRGYLQLLQSGMDPETSSLIKGLLIPEIDRANKIITDFLRIAKPSETSSEEMEIKAFMEEYIGKFLNSEALLHNISFTYTISEEAEGTLINGNKEEFLQVFINLFTNSFQAKSGTLEIHIEIVKNGPDIEIYFKDNGTGINPSMLPHIFDPFFTTKDEGTGLGLSVSKKIIENHGGSLSVRSSENGTTFLIVLPALY